MRRFVAVVLAAFVVGAVPPAGAAAIPPEPVAYLPPVDAVVVDRFRPPSTPFGPGNRGIDYATAPGQRVTAAAGGSVTFAGRVGAGLHVVVLHADGIRTSYSFLTAVDVRRGARVEQGDVLGSSSGDGFHFGARAGEAYVDPLVLLGQREGRVHLVDDDDRRPLAEDVERRLLLDSIRDRIRNGAATGERWVRERAAAAVARKVAAARAVVDSAIDLSIPTPVHLALAASRWERERGGCTPHGTPVAPPAGPAERIVVLVGGLGSSTGDAAVLAVDTEALGYDRRDVVQFNYRDDGRPYSAEDTLGDIDAAGARLAREVGRLQGVHPDAAVDVIAHSQGGLVARSAVVRHGAAPATLVTLASPHGGTDAATAAVTVEGTTSGHLALDGVGGLRPVGVDPNATAVLQMGETSSFLAELRQARWPPRTVTHVASIAARADPIVPNHQSRLEGADNTVVTPHGRESFADHDRLPGSPEATVEIGRALARQGPTCRTLREALIDEQVGRETSAALDAVGLTATAGGIYVDRRARGALTGASRLLRRRAVPAAPAGTPWPR